MSKTIRDDKAMRVLKTIVWLQSWATLEEIAVWSGYSFTETAKQVMYLHQSRQISRMRDYYGRVKFARVRELVGVPFPRRPD